MTVRYADGDKSIAVSIVGEWARGEVRMVMSASSGPKDYIKNQICAVFEQVPAIESIRMVIGEYKTSVPFCLFRVGEEWRDCVGKKVVIS